MPRAFSSGAASISSYFFAVAPPVFASVIVIAAVSVVLPWSTWPIVPMLQCGFVRSNFSLAIRVLPACFHEFGEDVGAGSGNRTRILSLEGCCTTIVLYPPNRGAGSARLSPLSSARGGGSRTRTYEG